MIARKAGIIAEVLATARTVAAFTAGPAEPGYPDAVSNGEPPGIGLHYVADDLVPGDQGKFGVGQLSVNDVQVRPAYCAGVDAYQDLSCVRLWPRHIGEAQRLAWSLQNHRAHGYLLRPTFFCLWVAVRIKTC